MSVSTDLKKTVCGDEAINQAAHLSYWRGMKNYKDIYVDEIVIPNIGPWKGCECVIKEIMDARGSWTGWFRVKLPNGEDGMFTGKELGYYNLDNKWPWE